MTITKLFLDFYAGHPWEGVLMGIVLVAVVERFCNMIVSCVRSVADKKKEDIEDELDD